MPTPKPTVNLPPDVEVQDTPDAPQKQQQQTESQQREAEKRKAEQDRKRAEEARQKAIEEAAKKAAEEAADRASDDIDIDGPFQIGEERIFGNRIFVWNGTTFVDTGRTVDEGDDGDEGSAGDEGDDGDDGDDDGDAGGAGGAGGGAGEQTPTDPDALRKQIEDAAKGTKDFVSPDFENLPSLAPNTITPANAAAPPSNAAILCSSTSHVGFIIREYIFPNSDNAKRLAACSVESN